MAQSAHNGMATDINLPQAAGNLAVQRLFRAGAIQAKLAISQPGDPDEEEADRVAEQVVSSAPVGKVQRKCAACAAGGTTCPKCEEEEKIQAKRKSGHTALGASTSQSVLGSLRGGGQPLSPATRAFFEPRFGQDFSGVRVHTGNQAAESAQAIQARAFTTGQDVVFGAGEFAPHSLEGQRLLAHELTHVMQQQAQPHSAVLQRQPGHGTAPAATPPAPEPPKAPDAPAPSPDAAKEIVEQEQKAFDSAKGRAGQPAATVLFSNPVSPSTKDSPENETFTIGEVLNRNAGDPVRHGFDTPGPATAFAATAATEVGGAVIQQEKFFFAARLNPGKHKLRVAAPTWTEWDWWRIGSSDHVYRVTPAPGVASVTGMGGFVFPPNQDLMDDPAKTRFLKNPQMATPADAKDMRKIAGVASVGEKSAEGLDQAEIPEAQQEAFIITYFRARGLEVLSANEKEANRLADVFKPTDPGSATKAASGVSGEAQQMINADRAQLKVYSELLEQEVKVEALLSFLKVCEERGEFPPFKPIYVKPQKAEVVALTNYIRSRQADVQRRKTGLLAASPLIGQLVGAPDPKSRFKEAERTRVNLIEYLSVPQIRGTSYEGVDNNLLARPPTTENDEAIRAEFLKKLDAVRKAIRDTRSEMYSDPGFLLGMEGLQLLVKQDLSGVKGKNSGLDAKLTELLRSHAATEKFWKDAEIVIQIGLLFIPGIGSFLSAIAGVGFSAAQMANDLRRWTASQASVNPATALVDQHVAEAQLARTTVELTINALALAAETIEVMKTMETAGDGKKLEARLKAAGEKEAQQLNEIALKPGMAGVRREVGGIPDAFGGSTHELIISERGVERCSISCWIFSASLRSRGDNIKASLGATDEIRKKATQLQARAESIGAKSTKIANLAESERAAQEVLLLEEAKGVEMDMIALEHDLLGIAGTRKPAQGTWTGTWPDMIWNPPPGSAPYEVTKGKGIPFHNGYPNFREWAIPGSDVSLPAMKGDWKLDFAAADSIAAARTGMADAKAFATWRESMGYTWHHVENSMTMLLLPQSLHNAVAHVGGGWVARGIPIP